MTDKYSYDLAIIGAGPSGLSAAIQAKRLGVNLVLIEKDQPGGQALVAYSIENYPGFAIGISGMDLMQKFSDQAKNLGIEIRKEHASIIEKTSKGYMVKTCSSEIRCKTVLVATGLKPNKLKIKGAREGEGNNLFYYANPSSLDHKGKRILVIGGGDAAFDQALNFASRASQVTIAMRGASPRCLFLLTRRAERRKIKIMRSIEPVEMHLENEGVKVKFAPTRSIKSNHLSKEVTSDYVIACIGKKPDLKILAKLINNKGRFALKPGPVKKWPGLYLAGDFCRGNLRQISIAAGDGMRAAMDIYSYLIESSNDENPFVHR